MIDWGLAGKFGSQLDYKKSFPKLNLNLKINTRAQDIYCLAQLIISLCESNITTGIYAGRGGAHYAKIVDNSISRETKNIQKIKGLKDRLKNLKEKEKVPEIIYIFVNKLLSEILQKDYDIDKKPYFQESQNTEEERTPLTKIMKDCIPQESNA